MDVYLIRCLSKPVYVGSTKRSYIKRFYSHFSEKYGRLHLAMRSYPSRFSVELLATTDDLRTALLMEYQAIRTYKTHASDGGYNVWRSESKIRSAKVRSKPKKTGHQKTRPARYRNDRKPRFNLLNL